MCGIDTISVCFRYTLLLVKSGEFVFVKRNKKSEIMEYELIH